MKYNNIYIMPQVMYFPIFVCLSFCLFVCEQEYSKSYWRILMKFMESLLMSQRRIDQILVMIRNRILDQFFRAPPSYWWIQIKFCAKFAYLIRKTRLDFGYDPYPDSGSNFPGPDQELLTDFDIMLYKICLWDKEDLIRF